MSPYDNQQSDHRFFIAMMLFALIFGLILLAVIFENYQFAFAGK